jgi:cytochrome c oxidase subunit II
VASTRSDWDGLWGSYLPIALGVAALVWGVMIFALVRYRRRPGREPGGRSEAPRLEATIATILALATAGLLALTFTTEARTDSTSPGQVSIDVTAFQWGWRFSYPGHGVTVVGNSERPPTFAVPAGETVSFELRSRDVIHAFWLPDERFKRDATPGTVTPFDVTFGSPGLEQGLCSEFCGLRHDAMRFQVNVMEPDSFRSWLAARSRG